jgi:hypothetical protein
LAEPFAFPLPCKSKLRHAVTDPHHRTKKSKQARDRPDSKDNPHAGKPRIITATRQHKRQLKPQFVLAM